MVLHMDSDAVQERTERDAQISAANSLVQLLSEAQHIRNAVEAIYEGVALSSGAEERISSITIEDMQKGPPKIVSKSYAGKPLTRELIDQHLDAHGYAHREAERRAMNGWAETVDIANHVREMGCETVSDGPGSWHWNHSRKCMALAQDGAT